MENRKEIYLPLGTIVLLKDDIVMHMISGYLGKEDDDSVKDYISVPFPYGLMATNIVTKFNHEDIENIVFYGYEDEKFKQFNEYLKNMDEIKK